MIIHGGKNCDENFNENYLSDLWIYNMDKNTWIEV